MFGTSVGIFVINVTHYIKYTKESKVHEELRFFPLKVCVPRYLDGRPQNCTIIVLVI